MTGPVVITGRALTSGGHWCAVEIDGQPGTACGMASPEEAYAEAVVCARSVLDARPKRATGGLVSSRVERMMKRDFAGRIAGVSHWYGTAAWGNEHAWHYGYAKSACLDEAEWRAVVAAAKAWRERV